MKMITNSIVVLIQEAAEAGVSDTKNNNRHEMCFMKKPLNTFDFNTGSKEKRYLSKIPEEDT